MDFFLRNYTDLFPRTSGTADIKIDVSSHVETVVLLPQQKPDDTIEIDLDLDEFRLISPDIFINLHGFFEMDFSLWDICCGQADISHGFLYLGIVQ